MSSEAEVVELDLRDYLGVIRRRSAVVVATMLVLVVGGLAISLVESPNYSARAKVLVAVDSNASIFNATVPVLDPNRVVQTEVQAFDSPDLRDLVRQRIGRAPAADAQQVDQTDVVEVVAHASTGKRAAEVASAYANAYVDLRHRQALDQVLSAAQQLQAKISDLQSQIAAASGDQQTALVDQQALFRQKLDELQVDSAVAAGGARVISDAAVPGRADSPDPLRTVLVALSFGLLLGVGLAVALDYMDDSIRTLVDLGRVVPGLSVLGLIPLFPNRTTKAGPSVVTLEEPTSPAAEAFRTLRTSVAFLTLEREIGVVQVTSPDAGDGKTTVTANLGVALNRAGRRVVLVDCDPRRPRLHEYLGVPGDVGLVSVLAGDVSLAEAVIAVPGLPHLSVLPAAPIPTNPAELLAGSRMAKVIDALRKSGSMVLLDSAPVLPVTDALVVSARAEATILVCMAGKTTDKQVRRAVELLGRVRAPLAGVVLTAVPAAESYGAAYDYSSAADVRPPGRLRRLWLPARRRRKRRGPPGTSGPQTGLEGVAEPRHGRQRARA